MIRIRFVSILLPIWVVGCATVSPPPPLADDFEMPEDAMQVRKGQAGGVFVPESVWSITSDNRAFRVGDVLTVVLQEATQASKKSNTNFGKNSGVNVGIPSFFGLSGFPTQGSLNAKRSFNGAGASSQQNTLQGSVTVVVQRVMPNGLLQVLGEKSLLLNQGEETVRLAGYVRAADIDTENRVSSQRVANARIHYVAKGTLAESGQPGWLTRFFNSKWMPF